MKNARIFIDSDKAGKELAKKIKSRLQNIEGIEYINVYHDIDEILDENGETDWEKTTLNQIDESNIIIPILNEDYLSFVTSSIEEKFDKIIESDNKFLLPILEKPSEWGSFKWVVKSKLTPSNGKALSELNESNADSEINDLIKTIKNIIRQLTKDNHLKDETQSIAKNHNVVFISHDHSDADFAELLKLKLEKNGLKGWMDNERLKIGQDWREEIDLGITSALAIIVIMTPEARKSEYVTYEWAYAWGKNKNVFPIMLKQTQLHPRLESLQYLDFTNRSSRPWNQLIESILDLTS